MPSPAIPRGSTVLITGVNGLIASHIANQLLADGYKVRGTVRDSHKGEWMTELFEKKYGKDVFEVVVVPDMVVEGAFDKHMEGISNPNIPCPLSRHLTRTRTPGCTAIVHVASILTFSPDPHSVITPVVNTTTSLLSSASRQPSITRFIYTSSSTAATRPYPNTRFHISSTTWNTADVADAWTPPPYTPSPSRRMTVYGASKAAAEQACWAFMKSHNPSFVFNSVLPDFVFGQILSPQQPASTAGWIKAVYDGDATQTEGLKAFPPRYMVDVKDVARLHVAALVEEDVASERLFAFAEPFNFNDVVGCMRRISPEKRFPEEVEGLERDLSTVETGRSVELLRRVGREGFTGMEQSIRENVGVM